MRDGAVDELRDLWIAPQIPGESRALEEILTAYTRDDEAGHALYRARISVMPIGPAGTRRYDQ